MLYALSDYHVSLVFSLILSFISFLYIYIYIYHYHCTFDW